MSDLIHALVSRKKNGVASIGAAVKMKDHLILPMEVRNDSCIHGMPIRGIYWILGDNTESRTSSCFSFIELL